MPNITVVCSVQWMKGKRSKRPRHHQQRPNTEKRNAEQLAAYSLLMLSSATRGFCEPTCVQLDGSGRDSAATSPSAFGLRRIRKKRGRADSNRSEADPSRNLRPGESNRNICGCKVPNKKFPSFQALSGHGGSQKKPGGFSPKIVNSVPREENGKLITREELSAAERHLSNDFHNLPSAKAEVIELCVNTDESDQPKEVEIHEWSIFHRVLATGQAQGGHKRRYCVSGGSNSDLTGTISSTEHPPVQEWRSPLRNGWLDLNLPAPVDEDDCIRMGHDVAPPCDARDAIPCPIQRTGVDSWQKPDV